MGNPDERVLCFPSSRLDEIGRWEGFCSSFIAPMIFDRKHTPFQFLPRSQVETDPSYKQLIPYVITQYNGPHEDSLILSYTRGKSGGEDRLKKFKSIGIGGHVSESVLSHRERLKSHINETRSLEFSYVKLEAEREINEEILVKSNKNIILELFIGC